jgi:hypothetical protein
MPHGIWTQFYAGRFSPSNRYKLSRQAQPAQLSDSLPIQTSRDRKSQFPERKSLRINELSSSLGFALHDRQIAPDCKSESLPKGVAQGVFPIHPDIALQNSNRAQTCKTFFYQPPTNPVATILSGNSEMHEITATAIMSTENSSDNVFACV